MQSFFKFLAFIAAYIAVAAWTVAMAPVLGLVWLNLAVLTGLWLELKAPSWVLGWWVVVLGLTLDVFWAQPPGLIVLVLSLSLGVWPRLYAQFLGGYSLGRRFFKAASSVLVYELLFLGARFLTASLSVSMAAPSLNPEFIYQVITSIVVISILYSLMSKPATKSINLA